MALLSTGLSTVKEADQQDQLPSIEPELLDLDTQVQSQLLQAFSNCSEDAIQISVAVQAHKDSVSCSNSTVVPAGPSVDPQVQPECNPRYNSFSPCDSPRSDISSDSGVTSDSFLAGLFGSEFPLLAGNTFEQAAILPLVQPTAASQLPQAWTHMPELAEPSTKPKTEPLADRNRKNAEAARQNRIKKKRYVDDLEKEASTLRTENVILKTKCHEFQQRCKKLLTEVEYLKGVLANESTLSALIQNIPNVPGVKLSSSFSSRKRPLNKEGQETNTSTTAKKMKRTISGGSGVCLHVSKDVVSLEFCQNCSKQASQS